MTSPAGTREDTSGLFELNDWPLQPFFTAVFGLMFFSWGLILLEVLGITLPIFRAASAFLFLTFMPGYLILRCLRLHRLGAIPSLLYAAGLSLVLLMVMGLAMDLFYPPLGIAKPISLAPLILTLSAVVLVLSLVAYARDRGFALPVSVDWSLVTSPITLFLALVPFLAIAGAYVVNSTKLNIFLVVMILLITSLILMVGFGRVIPPRLYPFAIFAIALALLYHNSLIWSYLLGGDIHLEYYFARLVELNGIWDPSIESNPNAMLSVTILSPAYAILTGLGITWIYKLVFPFLFALVAPALYQVYVRELEEHPTGRNRTPDLQGYRAYEGKIVSAMGFLSVIFIVSFSTFFTEMLTLARQEMAEFFLVAFMLLLVDREVAARERLIICLAFLLGMIISHYGLAWMYIGIFLLALLILRLLPDHGEQTFREPLIGVIFVEIFVIINLTWHLFTTSSTLFKDTGNRFLSIYQKFFTSFFHVQESQPATIMEQGIFAPLHIVSKFLNFFAIFLIGLGVVIIFLRVIFRSEGDPVLFDREYRALALANFAIFICGFVVPNLFMFNAFRVYHIVLFFLAPFTVVGIVFLLYATGRITRIRAFLRPRTWMMITSIYFAVLFLFGSGLVYEVTREHPSSISLSQETILGTGDLRDINNFFIGYFPESDIFGVQWISAYGNKTNLVYSDWPHHEMPMISYGMMLNTSFLMNNTRFSPGSLVYLGYMNNRYGIINGPYLFRNFWRRSELDPVLSRMNAVYTNGDTWIYQMP